MFKKILAALVLMAIGVLGALQVQNYQLPHFENLCGEWG